MPKPVVPSVPRRHFTVSQANKTLPLVSRIVQDIAGTYRSACELSEQLGEGLGAKHQQEVNEELERVKDKLRAYADELQEIGCELKDPSTGLVDFVGRHEGRDVCLCWKRGEKEIGFWHEMKAGFSGRREIGTLIENDG